MGCQKTHTLTVSRRSVRNLAIPSGFFRRGCWSFPRRDHWCCGPGAFPRGLRECGKRLRRLRIRYQLPRVHALLFRPTWSFHRLDLPVCGCNRMGRYTDLPGWSLRASYDPGDLAKLRQFPKPSPSVGQCDFGTAALLLPLLSHPAAHAVDPVSLPENFLR